MANEDYTTGTYSTLFEAVEQKKQSPTPLPSPEERTQKALQETKPSSNHDSMKSRNHDTTLSRHRETTAVDYIEIIRKEVKQIGKEVTTCRLTLEEKRALADIVYSLKTKGIRSSENELTRIAINYLVWEHRNNKQSSILSRVLERLKS